MTFTRDDWVGYFAPEANRRVRDWIVGWTTHEIGVLDQPDCQGFNLLNTHLGCESGGGPDAMCCRGDQGHIRRFSSIQEGAEGNRSVLRENHPGYAAIESAIENNDINALLTSSGVRQGLYTWVGFHTYDFLAPLFEGQGALHRNDTFLYGSPGDAPPASGGTTKVNPQGVTPPPGSNPCSALSGADYLACIAYCADVPGSTCNDPALYAKCKAGCDQTPDIPQQECYQRCSDTVGPTCATSGNGYNGQASCQTCYVTAKQAGQDPTKQCTEFQGVGNATPATPDPTQLAAGILQFLDSPTGWQRIIKGVLGGALILTAVGLAGYVLVEKVPGVKTAVETAGKVAAV